MHINLPGYLNNNTYTFKFSCFCDSNPVRKGFQYCLFQIHSALKPDTSG